MPVRKIAISLPPEVLGDIDRLAKSAHTTRSAFISRVLSEVSRVRTRAEMTARIDRLFQDLADEQKTTSDLFLRAAEPSAEGDENW